MGGFVLFTLSKKKGKQFALLVGLSGMRKEQGKVGHLGGKQKQKREKACHG